MSKKKVEVFYDRVSKIYDISYNDRYWQLYQRVTWDNLKKHLPENVEAKILDIGGGTGFWSARIAKAGYQNVVLADISAGMLDMARKKCEKQNIANQIEIVKCDICKMDMFEDGAFEMVLSEGDPISSCGNPRKAVKEIARVLKPGGKALCSVDNKFGAIHYFLDREKLDELEDFLRTGWSNWLTKAQNEQFGVKFFAPDELRQIFEKAGLAVQSMVGKTVIPWRRYYKLLDKRKNLEQIARIELSLNRESSLIGSASHIEVVAIKK